MDFNSFKSRCIAILAQSDNCEESQQLFRAANDYTDLVLAWQRFWAGIINEVPKQVMQAFDELYDIYKIELNRAGIFYNEKEITLARNAILLVGNAPHHITANGHGKVYILGKATVYATDNVRVYCHNADASVTLHDHAQAMMDGGSCVAYDFADITGRGDFTTHDSTTAFITGGTLTTKGHKNIKAYNDAVINSFTHKNIIIADNAKLLLNKQIVEHKSQNSVGSEAPLGSALASAH